MPQLSQKQAQQLQELLSFLDGAENPAVINKRTNKRSALRLAIEVTLLSSQSMPAMEVHTRNLSVSGMGFVSRREFQKDEHVVVHLNVPNHPVRLLLGRTMFCRYLRVGMYEVGLEFQDAACPGEAKIPSDWTIKVHGAVLRPVR